MKLFFYPHAPYTRKVMLAAYEKRITFDETEVVQPFDKDAMARLRADQHPLATVPLLKLDDGSFLTDSSIICEYLDQTSAGPTLVPAARGESLAVRAHDRFADTLLGATVYLTWALHAPEPSQNARKIASTRATFCAALGILDRQIGERGFVFGDTFSLADIGPSCAIADAVHIWTTKAELDPFPAVRRWYAEMQERDAWKKVHEASKLVPPPF